VENTRRISRPPVDLFFEKNIRRRIDTRRRISSVSHFLPTCIIQKGIKGSKNKTEKNRYSSFFEVVCGGFLPSQNVIVEIRKETWARRRRSVKAQERGFTRRGMEKLLTSITFLYFYIHQKQIDPCVYFIFFTKKFLAVSSSF
jgi:hypothetical protein